MEDRSAHAMTRRIRRLGDPALNRACQPARPLVDRAIDHQLICFQFSVICGLRGSFLQNVSLSTDIINIGVIDSLGVVLEMGVRAHHCGTVQRHEVYSQVHFGKITTLKVKGAQYK